MKKIIQTEDGNTAILRSYVVDYLKKALDGTVDHPLSQPNNSEAFQLAQQHDRAELDKLFCEASDEDNIEYVNTILDAIQWEYLYQQFMSQLHPEEVEALIDYAKAKQKKSSRDNKNTTPSNRTT